MRRHGLSGLCRDSKGKQHGQQYGKNNSEQRINRIAYPAHADVLKSAGEAAHRALRRDGAADSVGVRRRRHLPRVRVQARRIRRVHRMRVQRVRMLLIVVRMLVLVIVCGLCEVADG